MTAKHFTPRSCYVKNLNPQFVVPARHTHKLPFVLSDAIERNRERDLTAEIPFYVNLPVERCRRIYEHRRKALNALLLSILHHVNIISRKVPVGAEALADHCGLSTVSAAGNKSTSRATRALKMLKDLGFITYNRRWDRVSKRYFPADIFITEQLIELVGISPEKWQAEVAKKLAYYNKKNAERFGKAITESEYARIIREEQLEKVWQQRKAAREIKAKQKLAERLERLAKEKGEAELRHLVTRQVSDEYREGLLPDASLADLKAIVERRINTYRKTARSLPLH